MTDLYYLAVIRAKILSSTSAIERKPTMLLVLIDGTVQLWVEIPPRVCPFIIFKVSPVSRARCVWRLQSGPLASFN